MTRQCTKCDRFQSIIDEQKSKIQLLETRLKDLLRAYKLVLKEKDNLRNLNASITADVDSTQQKRISDLEENVIHMSSICGKFELEREHDKQQIEQLENECESLKKQLDNLKTTPEVQTEEQILPKVSRLVRQFRNKSSQTDIINTNNTVIKPSKLIDQGIQTDFSPIENQTELQSQSKTKHEMAIVAPLCYSESNLDEESVMPSESASVANNSGVSLFYANELARKELELTEARLRIRECECSIREIQWKYTNDKYRLQSRIADLELLNNNFMASKSDKPTQPMSTVNVAYIRNVLTKLLETKDKEQKQIMINALLTALKSIG
ncbi:hypothetical protein RDWZM_008743 [Blomia tropicalis]|uniref:GRIP domain-containing protein n=1 Tax=Blomia tropicalis TaxID=40697 RepID=A0A9Q0RLQ0_BLOTA|nr:hypothetical protein RDWZM_008743 [Blomia tropicalis]